MLLSVEIKKQRKECKKMRAPLLVRHGAEGGVDQREAPEGPGVGGGGVEEKGEDLGGWELAGWGYVSVSRIYSTCMTCRQAGRQAGRQVDRQTDGRTDGQTDGRTDRQTYRQTDGRTSHTYLAEQEVVVEHHGLGRHLHAP